MRVDSGDAEALYVEYLHGYCRGAAGEPVDVANASGVFGVRLHYAYALGVGDGALARGGGARAPRGMYVVLEDTDDALGA